MISEFFIEASLETHNICTVIPRSIPSVKLLYAAKGFPVDSVGTLTARLQGLELALLVSTPNWWGSKLLLTPKNVCIKSNRGPEATQPFLHGTVSVRLRGKAHQLKYRSHCINIWTIVAAQNSSQLGNFWFVLHPVLQPSEKFPIVRICPQNT